MSLSYSQARAIDITQKTGSSFSVVGEFLVILTFLSDSKFRKPVNRLVFYATWGNIFSNMATLIGQSAIRIGLGSPLCQFQAFLIQWLMPADALWIFVMACNVWLSFFHHWDAGKLKSLEWKYALFCYGCPFIPALVLLLVKSEARGRVYGDATLWCWISIEWDFLRVAVFYGPVWVIILLTFGIYLRVGAVIWKWRRRVHSVDKMSREKLQSGNGDTNTMANEIMRTDEVTVTSDARNQESQGQCGGSFPTLRPLSLRNQAYAVFARRSRSQKSKSTFRGNQTNKATIRYCKCAVLFFIALTVVWVPSSINRIWTLVYPDDLIFGLQFAAALVLPLQGFWNSTIYFATSMHATKCLWRDTLVRLGCRKPAIQAAAVPKRRELDTSDLSSNSRGGERECAESEADTIAGSDTDSLKPIQTSDTVT